MPTKFIKLFHFNANAPVQFGKKFNNGKDVTPMTQEEIREVRKYLKN